MVVVRAQPPPPSLTPIQRSTSSSDLNNQRQAGKPALAPSSLLNGTAPMATAAPLPPTFPTAVGATPSTGPRPPLRRGKWTFQEEAYVSRIIHDFNHGLLPLAAGTTLRAYLSDTLNCDPMRITKKFAGAACIGKRVFQPCDSSADTLERRRRAQAELEILRNEFLRTTTSSMLSSSYHGGTSLIMPLTGGRAGGGEEAATTTHIRSNMRTCNTGALTTPTPITELLLVPPQAMGHSPALLLSPLLLALATPQAMPLLAAISTLPPSSSRWLIPSLIVLLL